MKLACYSDLHLEFKHNWQLPNDLEADVLVLAGDIIVFNDFSPLKALLREWSKPVLFVPGNHEYYTRHPMLEHHGPFKGWLEAELPQVRFLDNEGTDIGGVNFFGGTMWTDFNNGNYGAKKDASYNMNDFRLICTEKTPFTPDDSIALHRQYLAALTQWFGKKLPGPHVVISHHSPVFNPNTRYRGSPLQPAFVANDVVALIEKYQPDLWIYGHTHECDNQIIGKTKIISNQLGYQLAAGEYECEEMFDEYGGPISI